MCSLTSFINDSVLRRLGFGCGESTVLLLREVVNVMHKSSVVYVVVAPSPGVEAGHRLTDMLAVGSNALA